MLTNFPTVYKRIQRLKELESLALKTGQTQLFIETPYRNEKMFGALLAHCRPQTLLCVATDLTLPGESIKTRSIAKWKSQPEQLELTWSEQSHSF